MKIYKLLLVSLGVLYFTSCEKELDRDLTDVSVRVATNENVRYEGNILTVKKGTPVEFLLHGDPDYVSFFSGELGHQYIYRDRKEYSAEDVESCELKFGVWTATGNANSCTNQLDILYLAEEQETDSENSTAFPGMSKTNFEADSVLVEKTTVWKTFIPRTKLPTSVLGSAANALNYSESVKKFIGKKLTLAIAFNKDGKKSSDFPPYSSGDPIPQSTFNFVGMRVETTWKNGRVTTAYASSFGFTPLNMKNKTVFKDQAEINMPKDREYGSVTTGVSGMWNLSSIANGSFAVTGAATGSNWKYTWLVSDYLNLLECPSPDSGVKVKDVSQELNSYTYTYNQVGTYTATFLMNNSNYAHAASKTCELIINVTE
ncbi:DUF5017 domain-containing protein [uncultured Bacteroides sp.]|jgi:hypothetical protein|uniref:DUF5017 domain-containing protein n=1 Tax=uncultured Bacteroides sp. TaxID=162156 RepID=UPI00280B5CED|nr:DUF5017 domain-containing protein [uncultured Bacteroides sp.]